MSIPSGACDDSGSAGDPVSLYDGRLHQVTTDLVVNGLYPIVINRRYDSRSTYDSPLGYGWSINPDRRLYQYPDGSVIIRYGCGVRDRFVYTGGGYTTPSDGRQGDLVENPDGSFVYTRRYTTKEFYDSQGRLTAVQNRYGHRHEFSYDPAGKLPLTGTSPFSIDPSQPMTIAYNYRLTRIDERAADGLLTGNFVTFAYDPTTGRLQSVTSSDGRTVSYVHDSLAGLTSGNLIRVNGLQGVVSVYLYQDPNDAHNLTSNQEQPGDTPWVTAYDSQDRVIQQNHGSDLYVFDYVVDLTETLVTHTIRDAAGENPYDATRRYFFDGNGDVEKSRDALGNEIVYTRDSAGSMISKAFYENSGTLAAPTLELQRTIDFGYDPLQRRTSQSVTLDSGETIIRSWSYDHGWLASSQVVSDADPGKIFRTEYTFYRDVDGVPTNVESVRRRKDDGSFQVTSFAYDGKNRLVATTLADGQVIRTEYEAGSLYPTRRYFEVDDNGTPVESPYGRMRFGYDAKGDLNQIWDPRDNSTTHVFDDRHRLVQTTNALGEESYYGFTGLRLTQVEVGHTAAEGEGQVTRFGYSADGWLTSIEEKDDAATWQPVATFTYDSAGNRLTSADALGRTTTYQYDLLGRTTTVIDPLLKTTTFAYDMFHHQTATIDAMGRQTVIAYDDLDRVASVDRQGVTPSALTQFGYDAAGNLLTLTDAEGHTTTYTVDSLSRVTAITQPLGQTVQRTYDNRNRLVEVVNARGNRIVHTYDPWDVLVQTRYFSDAADPTADRTVDYVYDHAFGLTSVTDSSVQAGPLYAFTYDALNRVSSTVAKYIPGGDRTLVYGYDRYGNRNAVQLVDGATFSHSYQFDKRNRLTSAVLPGAQTFTASYTDSGELQQLVYPNGVVADYVYEANGPVQSITYSGSGGPIEQFSYTYDDVQNVLSMTDANGVTSYSYDGLDRLTGADHPASVALPDESYTYDRVGNREDPTDASLYAYDANNRITASPGLTYSFDADGNMTGRSDGLTLGYRSDNRLASITDGSVFSTYGYDPFRRRLEKTVAGQTTWFLWDGPILTAEFDSSGNRERRYAYLPGRFTATQVVEADFIYNVHPDNREAPRALTDVNDQVVWRLDQAAFGAGVVDEDVDGDNNKVIFDQRLRGQHQDDESSLHYNYMRFFDPSIGRYLSTDPLQTVDDTNIYQFARNSPTSVDDPLGLAWVRLAVRVTVYVAKSLHWERNRLNHAPVDLEDAVAAGGRVLPLEESGLHMFSDRGIDQSNLKLVFPDGSEGVYDSKTGKRIADPANQGTYNVFNPDPEPGWQLDDVLHAAVDIAPYFAWGNSRDDPTTLWRRIEQAIATNMMSGIEGSKLRPAMVERSIRENRRREAGIEDCLGGQ